MTTTTELATLPALNAATGSPRVGIVGLGYVGLPLAVEFGKRYDTLGYDLKEAHIEELRQGRDSTLESSPEDFGREQQPELYDGCGHHHY